MTRHTPQRAVNVRYDGSGPLVAGAGSWVCTECRQPTNSPADGPARHVRPTPTVDPRRVREGRGGHPDDTTGLRGRCPATYRALGLRCERPAGHDGDHTNSTADAPSTLAWSQAVTDRR